MFVTTCLVDWKFVNVERAGGNATILTGGEAVSPREINANECTIKRVHELAEEMFGKEK